MPLFTRRRLFTGLAAFGAVAGVLGLRSASARYYDGPVSDHFDGTRFFDPHSSPPKSIATLFRWYTKREKAEWPAWAPSSYQDKPPARVAGPEWRLSCVGHASWLLQTAGLNILIDPGIAFADLPPIDIVLVSHCHYDHLDLETLSRLEAMHHPRVITPLGNDTIMKDHDPAIRAEAHDWHERVELGKHVALTLVPTRHWSARGLTDRNKALWASFVIETPAGRVYHVADSGWGDGHHFRAARDRYGPFRLRRAADRRLRAALVHGRPAHEPGRVGAGVSDLWRRIRARPPLRHVPAH